jgi:hypothetical protein
VIDLTPIVSAFVPTLVGLLAAQRLPDTVVPIKANPETPAEKLTVIGAAVAVLSVVEAVQNGRHDQIDPVQFIAALTALWMALPRAHQILDAASSIFKKKAE